MVYLFPVLIQHLYVIYMQLYMHLFAFRFTLAPFHVFIKRKDSPFQD